VLGLMAAVTGEWQAFQPSTISVESFFAFAYLTLVGSLIAYTTYTWLLGVAPLPLVTTYAYVNPVVAVILGAIVLGEPIDARTLVAGAVIVVAVALIVTTRGRMRRPAQADLPDGMPLPDVIATPDVTPQPEVTPQPGSSGTPVVRAP
jgi:drug/metabolite transporter (DMT)-like permease